MNDKIEIELSKTKLLLLVLGAAAFVVLGLFMLFPGLYTEGNYSAAPEMQIAGALSVAFFGLCLVFAVRKFLDKKIGLILDDQGITDHSSGTSVGLIEWEDLVAIETIQIASTRMLMLITDKPDKYIARAKNGISRTAMKANHKMYGSPLHLAATSLKISFTELEQLVYTEFEKRRA